MAFGDDIAETHSACQKTATGVDAQESITLFIKMENGNYAIKHLCTERQNGSHFRR